MLYHFERICCFCNMGRLRKMCGKILKTLSEVLIVNMLLYWILFFLLFSRDCADTSKKWLKITDLVICKKTGYLVHHWQVSRDMNCSRKICSQKTASLRCCWYQQKSMARSNFLWNLGFTKSDYYLLPTFH